MPRSHPVAPDLVVLARRIHLLGDHPPVAALLVRGGRVVAAGTEAEVRAAALPGARVESLGEATVTPGLTDAHVHLTTWALARRRVDLNGARTAEEAVERVRAAVSPGGAQAQGEWVLGQGWDMNRWGVFPTREMLDAVVPGRPAFLESHDIHAAWLNTEALRRLGIDRGTPDPEGGTIVRDGAGEATGVLLENAKWLAAPLLPEPTAAEKRAALLDAQREVHRLGITGVHSVEFAGLEDFGALEQDGLLRLRVLQAVQLDRLDAAIRVGLRSGLGSEWLRIGGVKMFLDGALGSRTAWLREPYIGSESDRGIETLLLAEFREAVWRAAEAGIASTVHAIGDAAVERALEVLSSAPGVPAMPHRIEHLQLCPPELWERAGRSGIVASMQPVHLLTDIPAAERHWGHERSRGAYAFAPLLRAGMTLAFGSDVPVETVDPRPGLFAATKRITWEGEPAGEWYPEHRLTAEEALRGYTEGPAVAAGEEGKRGRLLPGYDADLAAWDVDPLAASPEELRGMRCLLTAVGGEVMFREGGG
ncbi:MAG TPA: amidohydrolase [Longimicrobiaceae bacterium]|nr:amidohydrolase [Longimicrobiaceae bacterium]